MYNLRGFRVSGLGGRDLRLRGSVVVSGLDWGLLGAASPFSGY